MLTGALGAVLYMKKDRLLLALFNNKPAQIAAWLVIGSVAINRFHIFSVIDHEVISVVTVMIIIGQVEKKNRILSLENNVFDFLGKTSYGIYVIHPLVIYLLGKSAFIKNLPLADTWKYIIIFALALGLTILLAWLSYQYFEKWFLKKKMKYAEIQTSSTRTHENLSDKTTNHAFKPALT
jgi:peptidoglycan/LPS O-acetylase OafA/YrhL